jgi:hypothetical protein
LVDVFKNCEPPGKVEIMVCTNAVVAI